MSHARNQLIASLDHIKTLKVAIGLLTLVVFAQWFRIGHLQDVRRVYVPPNLTQGVVTKFDEVPPPVVYTFAYYIFQQLNRWKTDGEEDYPKQIYRLQGFLTPSCISTLEDDMNTKRRKGELRQRIRMVQEISGKGFNRQRIQQTSDGRWNVWLDLNVKETIGHHEVKNVDLRYHLTVVTFDVDKEVNPWGLALECVGELAAERISASQ